MSSFGDLTVNAITTPIVDGALMTLVTVSFLVILARNLVSLIQLLTAARVFATRVRPASRSVDLWARYGDLSPPVSVIAPAFNEALSIVDSVRALLALEYPDYEVIVVNDGSTDETLATLLAAFEMSPSPREQSVALQTTRVIGAYRSYRYPNLLVVDKENGRKADAANAGIGFAIKPLVCVIDADSIIEPDGLLRATEPFMSDDGRLVAVGGAIRIVNGCEVRGGHIERMSLSSKWLPRFQVVEYMRAFITARVANAELGMLTLISGAFGIFKRSVLVEIGGYRHDTVGEDFELVVRIHRHMREQKRAYRIGFVPDVVCWTEAPETLVGLRNQRSRWEQGGLETIWRHRRMLMNPRYGRIGMVALPLTFVEDVLGPPLELAGYVVVPVCWELGTLSPPLALAFLALTVIFGTAISVGTLALEERQLQRTPDAADLARLTFAAFLENFGYRQINLVYRLRGIWRYARQDNRWAAVPRVGFDRASQGAPVPTAYPAAADRRAPTGSAARMPQDLSQEDPVGTSYLQSLS
jgi:cellulose synthase/poly-beta-1,6-N-acetylglucosamine synthase-like glycosyltransferase